MKHEAARTHCSSAERRGLFKCRTQFLRTGAVSVVWADFCVNNRAVVGDHEMRRIGSAQLSLPLLGRARASCQAAATYCALHADRPGKPVLASRRATSAALLTARLTDARLFQTGSIPLPRRVVRACKADLADIASEP
jgi:hypothetical protein